MDEKDSVPNVIEDFDKKRFRQFLQKLTKCGINAERCTKAIAATGITSERAAAEWIAGHIDDPELDHELTLDFYIFLCPTDRLRDSVTQYWNTCKPENGWNQAQEYLPHITITPRFQISESKVVTLHQAIRNRLLKQSLNRKLLSVPLELLSICDPLDSKKSFLGFQAVGQTKSVLDQLSNALLADLDSIGIVMEDSVRRSRKGIFHLSLAYGFSQTQLALYTSHMNELILPLIKEESLADWELCLFSCDSRLRSVEEMYSMKSNLKYLNELSLSYYFEDLVGLIGQAPNSPFGCAKGFNCHTGQTGTFLPEMGSRVPIHNAWNLHLKISLDQSSCYRSPFDTAENRLNMTLSVNSSSISINSTQKSEKGCRKIYVMRHGERVDFCFRNWISKCFDSKGIYKRHNLNMPVFLPNRKPESYFHDSPLTVIGAKVAFEIGVALKIAGVSFTRCYCSPALRCVQTATQCLNGLGQEDIGIRIEPLLFEWMGWYKSQMPSFLSPEQLRTDGFPVVAEYSSLSKLSELRVTETPSQYYERKGRLVKRIVEQNKRKNTCLLIVGHAASLDVCTRPFVSKTNWPPQISDQEFHARSAVVPFCGIAVAEERTLRWQLIDPPIPTFSHCKNGDFSWKQVFLSQ